MTKSDYKYIVFNGSIDLYHYVFYDFLNCPNIYYDESFFEKRIAAFFRHLHWSKKINNISNLPLKSLWIDCLLNKYEKKLFLTKEDKIIFLIIGCNYMLEKYGFSNCIKRKFPNAKIVYFFCDLVEKDINKQLFLKDFRRTADLIYSFDIGDAKKYLLKFQNLVYSDVTPLFHDIKIKYDISFVGRAKDRLQDIINTYKELTNEGLRCFFYITGSSKKHSTYLDGIIYGDEISYLDYLKIELQSKCILEIVQKNSLGNTLRVNEAVCFDKILISNNKFLLKNSLYDRNNMFVFDDLKTDKFHIKEMIKNRNIVTYNQEVKSLLNPFAFLKRIENDLINYSSHED